WRTGCRNRQHQLVRNHQHQSTLNHQHHQLMLHHQQQLMLNHQHHLTSMIRCRQRLQPGPVQRVLHRATLRITHVDVDASFASYPRGWLCGAATRRKEGDSERREA
ncbi:unnamed protein product, partial [Ectocarpus sp. 6 AP-2014]